MQTTLNNPQPPMREHIQTYAGKILLGITAFCGFITLSDTEAIVRICAGIAATLAGVSTAIYYVVKMVKNKY